MIKKYREVLLYLVFGVLTTAVNYVVFFAAGYLLPAATTLPANTIAWILAVLFAYLTNRKFVFNSQATGTKAVLAEIAAFFGARLFSGILDLAVIWVTVDLLDLNVFIMKLLSNVLVIALNYLFSKFWIFKKK